MRERKCFSRAVEITSTSDIVRVSYENTVRQSLLVCSPPQFLCFRILGYVYGCCLSNDIFQKAVKKVGSILD